MEHSGQRGQAIPKKRLLTPSLLNPHLIYLKIVIRSHCFFTRFLCFSSNSQCHMWRSLLLVFMTHLVADLQSHSLASLASNPALSSKLLERHILGLFEYLKMILCGSVGQWIGPPLILLFHGKLFESCPPAEKWERPSKPISQSNTCHNEPPLPQGRTFCQGW